MFSRSLLIALCLSATGWTAWGADSGLHWRSDLDQAKREAAASGRLVMVHFWAPWCVPCMKLDKNVLKSDAVATSLEKYYVPVKLNLDNAKATAQQFGVRSIPADVIITPQGKLVKLCQCPQTSDAYVAQLSGVAVATNAQWAAQDAVASAAAQAQSTAAQARTAVEEQAALAEQKAVASVDSARNAAQSSADRLAQSGRDALGRARGSFSQAANRWHNAGQEKAEQARTAAEQGVEQARQAGEAAGQAVTEAANEASQTGEAWAAASATAADDLAAAGSATIDQATNAAQDALAYPDRYSAPPHAAADSNAGAGAAPVHPVYGRRPVGAAKGENRLASNSTWSSRPPVQTGAEAAAENHAPAGDLADAYDRDPAAEAATAAPPRAPVDRPLPSQSTAQPQPTAQRAASSPIVLPAGCPPLAIDGYCPVSIQAQQRWKKGDVQWGAIHRERTYLFVSQEHQQMFLADPDRYAPVLDGNDPVIAVREGRMVPGRRALGVMLSNRVYLFASEETRDAFERDHQRLADAALKLQR